MRKYITVYVGVWMHSYGFACMFVSMRVCASVHRITPPFNLEVSSNVDRGLLSLIKRHFLRGHKYHKFFNLYNVKVSHSCLDNITSNIERINKRKNAPTLSPTAACNFQSPIMCTLEGSLLPRAVIYRATLTPSHGIIRYYTGMTVNNFKRRYSQHMHSFEPRDRKKFTSLSHFLWRLRTSETKYPASSELLSTQRHHIYLTPPAASAFSVKS